MRLVGGGWAMDAVWDCLRDVVLEHLGTGPVALLAYGSRVLGRALPDSDYDVYIVGRDYGAERLTRTAMEQAAWERCRAHLDLHGCSPDYAESYLSIDPQLNAAMRTGTVIYGDASRWMPPPRLSAIGVSDICITTDILLQGSRSTAYLDHVRKELLLTRLLLESTPDWQEFYDHVRVPRSPGELRREAKTLLKILAASVDQEAGDGGLT